MSTPTYVTVRNDGPNSCIVLSEYLNPGGARRGVSWKTFVNLQSRNPNLTAIRDQDGQVITPEQLAAWLAPQEETEDANEGGEADETTPLEAVSGIGQATAQKLINRGIDSAEALAALSEEQASELVESGFVSASKLGEWITAAYTLLATTDEE